MLKVNDDELPFVTSNVVLMQANSSDFAGMESIKEKGFFRLRFSRFFAKISGQKAFRIMKKGKLDLIALLQKTLKRHLIATYLKQLKRLRLL